MVREKKTLGQQILGMFISHPWLKLISLILAVLVWVYVKNEIGRDF
jgi:hypothetical protein